MPLNRTHVTIILGIAQTLSWASSYYLLAVLAEPISRAVDISYSSVFGAFSLALLVAAVVGPVAGRLIDRFGGWPVLMTSNFIFATGLLLLSQATEAFHVFIAWAVMGVAMGSGLYEAAFSAVVYLYGQKARSVITGITLFAGFASTVGWPLSGYIEGVYGWETVCGVWAVLHVLIGFPLNMLLSKAVRESEESSAGQDDVAVKQLVEKATEEDAEGRNRRRNAWLMAYVFAVSWFISTAMAAHLPQVLQASGAVLVAAIAAAALVGPAQVAGRVLEYSFLKRAHPLLSARLAILAHPVAALCLGMFGSSAIYVFTIFHGLGNGILTIAIGTLPLKVFGAEGYGQRQGWLMAPARVVQAGSPFLFGLALANWGSYALWLSTLLALSAFMALWAMRVNTRQ